MVFTWESGATAGTGFVSRCESIRIALRSRGAISQGTTFALILGAGVDKRGGGDFDVDWVFAELRGRLVSLRTLGGLCVLDVGLLARYAQGNSGQTATFDPKLFAGGVYLQQHLTMNSKGRGFSLSGSFSYGGLGNLNIDQNVSTLMAALQWLP